MSVSHFVFLGILVHFLCLSFKVLYALALLMYEVLRTAYLQFYFCVCFFFIYKWGCMRLYVKEKSGVHVGIFTIYEDRMVNLDMNINNWIRVCFVQCLFDKSLCETLLGYCFSKYGSSMYFRYRFLCFALCLIFCY